VLAILVRAQIVSAFADVLLAQFIGVVAHVLVAIRATHDVRDGLDLATEFTAILEHGITNEITGGTVRRLESRLLGSP
jgi:hypothetical protein